MGVTVDTKVQVAQKVMLKFYIQMQCNRAGLGFISFILFKFLFKSVTIAILDVTADMHAMQTVKAVTKRQVCVSLAVNLDGKAVCVIQVRLIF